MDRGGQLEKKKKITTVLTMVRGACSRGQWFSFPLLTRNSFFFFTSSTFFLSLPLLLSLKPSLLLPTLLYSHQIHSNFFLKSSNFFLFLDFSHKFSFSTQIFTQIPQLYPTYFTLNFYPFHFKFIIFHSLKSSLFSIPLLLSKFAQNSTNPP